MKTGILLLLALLLQGCVTTTTQEVANANFGPLPADYQERVREFMKTQIRLRPETATFEFHEPHKGVYQQGYTSRDKHYGWIVQVGVRVKNHFGMHVSDNAWVFIGADGQIADCTVGMGQLARYVD